MTVRVADAVMLGVAVGVLVASGIAVDEAVGVRVRVGGVKAGAPVAAENGRLSVARKATAALVGCETKPRSTAMRSTALQPMGDSPCPKAASPRTARGTMANAHTTGVRISPTRAVSRNVGRRVERWARAGARRRSAA